MDMFFWLMIAIAAVAYLVSNGKRKRKGDVNRRKTDYQAPNSESHERTPQVVREQAVAERQLTSVRSNDFRKRPLMNKGEYGVFCRLEALMSKNHPDYRVFAQISMGEILSSANKEAYLSVNSKRADFVIINRSGYPVAVVEYQGEGHYQEDARTRDAVKREAYKSAGISFIELPASYSTTDIEAIGVQLSRKAA